MNDRQPRAGRDFHPSDVAPSPRATMIVPLDGSARAPDALPVAQGLARLFDATVHIVHVSPHHLPSEEVGDLLKLTHEQVADCILNQQTGAPAPAIIHEAKKWESRLIVMCAHTRAENPEGGLGSIARDILPNTPCPIVLVPPGRDRRPWSLRRLLLPHDGTPTNALVVGPVADLARRAQAEVTVLHVATAAAAPAAEPGTFTAPRYMDQPHHEWPAWGREFLDRARAVGNPEHDLKLRTVFCTEDIGQAIVRFASPDETDLIALAWRLSLDPQRALTMRYVIRHARCPVMIYPVRGN